MKYFNKELLRVLMANEPINMTELSRELEIPYTTMVSWMNGQKKPKITAVKKLADRFDIPRDDLMKDYNTPEYNKKLYSEYLNKYLKGKFA